MPNRKAKLLIVDDEPSTRTLLGQIFGGMGHPVRAAEDGFTALEQMREEMPDVLLSDLNMPRMSGFELLSVVRRRMPKVFVIATSGAFSGDQVPQGIAADAFYEKGTGLLGLFDMMKTVPPPEQPLRPGRDAATPIWISPTKRDAASDATVLISCPECLRSFSLAVGAADFVIHEVGCVYCATAIHYATVQPMNPELPHRFHAKQKPVPAEAMVSAGELKLRKSGT